MTSFRHPRSSRPHLRTVSITGVGSYVPERILTNAELEKIVETSDEWITSRTGIKERRIAAPGEATSDLATEAAKRALEVTASARSSPDLMCGATTAGVATWMSNCWLNCAMTAGPEPL